MPMEDGVNIKPLASEGVEEAAAKFDAIGYFRDNPSAGLQGVVNDRRQHNPVRRDHPYGR